jgi:hypothetical protein
VCSLSSLVLCTVYCGLLCSLCSICIYNQSERCLSGDCTGEGIEMVRDREKWKRHNLALSTCTHTYSTLDIWHLLCFKWHQRDRCDVPHSCETGMMCEKVTVDTQWSMKRKQSIRLSELCSMARQLLHLHSSPTRTVSIYAAMLALIVRGVCIIMK